MNRNTVSLVCFGAASVCFLVSTVEGNDAFFPLGVCLMILGMMRANKKRR